MGVAILRAAAADQVNHDHHKYEPVDIIRRSPPQRITASRREREKPF
jgi:hypothetical protein